MAPASEQEEVARPFVQQQAGISDAVPFPGASVPAAHVHHDLHRLPGPTAVQGAADGYADVVGHVPGAFPAHVIGGDQRPGQRLDEAGDAVLEGPVVAAVPHFPGDAVPRVAQHADSLPFHFDREGRRRVRDPGAVDADPDAAPVDVPALQGAVGKILDRKGNGREGVPGRIQVLGDRYVAVCDDRDCQMPEHRRRIELPQRDAPEPDGPFRGLVKHADMGGIDAGQAGIAVALLFLDQVFERIAVAAVRAHAQVQAAPPYGFVRIAEKQQVVMENIL